MHATTSSHGTADPVVTFRVPTLGDAASMTRLVRTSSLDDNSHYAYLLLCHHFADTCVVADLDGSTVGFVGGYRPPRQPDTLFVWQVAVDERARGQGVAGRMLDELVTRAGDVRFVEATVTPSNSASRALFQSLAKRHDVPCEIRPLFTADVFEGVAEDHEPEELFRIGPFPS